MTRFSDTERVKIPLLAIGPAPLALEPLVSAVAAESDGVDGAIVTFLGLVRNHNQGRRVQYLEYEAYEPLALKAFSRISGEDGCHAENPSPDRLLQLAEASGFTQ